LARLQKPKLSSAAKKLLAQSDRLGCLPQSLLREAPPEIVDEAFLFDTYPVRRRLLTDLANLWNADAVTPFWKRWARVLSPEWEHEILELRNELRAIWQEPESASSQQTLDKWLRWSPSAGHLALHKAIYGTDEREREPRYYMPFWCSLRAGKLVPNFLSNRAMMIQGVLENWQHFRFCTNPECLSPYFIAKRRDQTVCDAGDCKAIRQREHALKWWNANRAKLAR